MSDRGNFCDFSRVEQHKGFYNDDNFTEALFNIKYADFNQLPDDDEFIYRTAYVLMHGSCQIFALSLKKMFGYTPYVIEEIHDKGFHAFCQVNKDGNLYYIDARGITSSFDEFMEVAGEFVKEEYIIRPVNFNDIEDWEKECEYNEEVYAFAEYVIRTYNECYVL